MMIWTSNIYFLISFFLLQGIDSGIAPVTTFANPAALCNRDIWPSFGVAEGIPDWRGVKLTFSCLIRAGVCGQMALLEGCRATHTSALSPTLHVCQLIVALEIRCTVCLLGSVHASSAFLWQPYCFPLLSDEGHPGAGVHVVACLSLTFFSSSLLTFMKCELDR